MPTGTSAFPDSSSASTLMTKLTKEAAHRCKNYNRDAWEGFNVNFGEGAKVAEASRLSALEIGFVLGSEVILNW